MEGARIVLGPLLLLLLLLAAAAVAVVDRVPRGSIGLPMRADRVLGPARGPGLHFSSPFTRHVLLPGDPRDHRGVVRVRSPEGATLAVPYDATIALRDADPEVLARVASGVSAGKPIGRAIDDAFEGDANGSPADQAERFVRRLGGVEGTLRVGQPRAISGRAHPLRDVWGGPRSRVVLIGVDSADWDLIDPLIEAGDLPHLAALKARGAWGALASMTPTLSPILWTTIATGRPPEDHGILDFLMVDPDGGGEVPISRMFRRVKALWNIAGDLGVRSATVGWWATWPAEAVDGAMVTDRVAYTLFDLPLDEDQPGLVYPPGLLDRVEDLRIEDEDITYEEVRAIVPIPRDRFERARAALEGAGGWIDPVAHLIRVIAGTRTYHRIGLHLLREEAPDLALLYYEGLDEVNHRFAHYLPPPLGLVADADPGEREAFSVAVPNFYRYQDRLIGEIVDAAGDDAVILIVSDHGFANGSERPTDVPPDIEGRPGLWHGPEGVILVAGPTVAPGRLERTGLLDITPTVLSLLGLPQAADMPGRPIPSLHADAAEIGVTVASYDTIGEPLQAAGGAISSPQDEEMIARLRALGYIDAGEAVTASGTPTSHVNAGHIFLRKREFDRAEAEFTAARAIAPGFDQAHLGLAQVALDRGDPGDAIVHIEAALRLPDPRAPLMTRAARVYARAGRHADGISFLQSLALDGRADAYRHAAVGLLHEALRETREAERAYREALARDASVVPALRGLYLILRDRSPEDLAAILSRSLRIEPPGAASRAANWLALTRERQGRGEEAIGILTGALDRDPDNPMTLTNLGSMLVRVDRAAEGIPYLDRARAQRPGSHEILVNLIVAHGKLGDRDGAEALFDEARSAARPEEMPPLLNAIAYACYLNGAADQAARHLDESLARDPDQPEARALRETVRGGAL